MLGDRAELKRREPGIKRDSVASQASHCQEIHEEFQGIAVMQEDSVPCGHAETRREIGSCLSAPRCLMTGPAAPGPGLGEIAEVAINERFWRQWAG